MNGDLECGSHGPDGAVCQSIRDHRGQHQGMTPRGAWIFWIAQ